MADKLYLPPSYEDTCAVLNSIANGIQSQPIPQASAPLIRDPRLDLIILALDKIGVRFDNPTRCKVIILDAIMDLYGDHPVTRKCRHCGIWISNQTILSQKEFLKRFSNFCRKLTEHIEFPYYILQTSNTIKTQILDTIMNDIISIFHKICESSATTVTGKCGCYRRERTD